MPEFASGDSYKKRHRRIGRRRGLLLTSSVAGLAALLFSCGAWLASTAAQIESELEAATTKIPSLKENITQGKGEEAKLDVEQLRAHTTKAKEAASEPLWVLASNIPGAGANFFAVAEITQSLDDVVGLGLSPLVNVMESLDWNSLVPGAATTSLQPLQQASPSISSAAHAVRGSAERLGRIDTEGVVPQIAEPLIEARSQLEEVTGALDAAAYISQIAPNMMGAEGPRNYLLMVQNNAESRASGGIPGALAVLNLDGGKLQLAAQSSAGEVGVMSPILTVDPVQRDIYSTRMAKFFQDVNLTPDFPTAATSASAMWERKTGQRVDGVISVDPVALGYILDATGPVRISDAELSALAGGKLPTELTGQNVVPTLLSDVYSKIQQPALQDAYFAGVAQEIFTTLASGKADAKALVDGITRGTTEGRVLIWSQRQSEQSIIARYSLSGSIEGPSVAPAQFGVYFNDGTGAKMDYYVRRTVQLVKECPKDGYEQTTVRITSTNTAPSDAGTSLPSYVTGNGAFGVPAGAVQTNIVAYGPAQANVETAKLDGKRTEFAPYLHANRPVGMHTVRLSPGETKTLEFTFGKIAQHAEPNVFVTPTVQSVKDVTRPTETSSCE